MPFPGTFQEGIVAALAMTTEALMTPAVATGLWEAIIPAETIIPAAAMIPSGTVTPATVIMLMEPTEAEIADVTMSDRPVAVTILRSRFYLKEMK